MLKAYHNDVAVKEKYLERVKLHRIADNLVQGETWHNGKGCAIGCTLEAYDHSRYPIELGIPENIARLEDCIFEGLTNAKSQLWPERFLSTVKVGSNLSKVCPKFLLSITKRRYEALNDNELKLVGNAIEQVIKVLADWVEFGKVNKSAAWSAVRAAESAASAAESAASAAWSAVRAAESAAWSAVRAAESAASAAESAASAAWSAVSAVRAAESAASAAESAEYEWMADELIRLIEEC